MIRISNIKFNRNACENEVISKALKANKIIDTDVKSAKLSKHSIDARKKDSIKYVYSIDLEINEKAEKKLINNKDITAVPKYVYEIPKIETDSRPIIIGAGPSGLFSALIMVEAGVKPIIVERGKTVEEREIDVDNLLNNGVFDENSNIVFGEGGAGTFSDGKLTTGVKDTRKQKVLELFVKYGAPNEILYATKPHIGTDNLRVIIKNMRNDIIKKGGEFYFNTLMTDLIIDNDKIKGVVLKDSEKIFELLSDNVCICTGHSSHETFRLLLDKKIKIEAKSFAVGFRIEHKREFINATQYGSAYEQKLPTAEYKLAEKTANGRNVYTFCMCPGGVVVPSMSNKNTIVVNGMSYYKRDLENSNSAILVNVTPEDFAKYTNDDSALNGLLFQNMLEEKAFTLGGGEYKAPVQLVEDFIENKKTDKLKTVKPTYKPDVSLANLNEIFPDFINEALKDGLLKMDKKIKGFASNDSIITGVETRSSSPIKIVRDENLQTNISGLFAVGEGSGYSGGITSSCIDGIKCAEKVIDKLR